MSYENSQLYRIRHSTAHVLAEAMDAHIFIAEDQMSR
jgi:threonyl-tRNA synthetase